MQNEEPTAQQPEVPVKGAPEQAPAKPDISAEVEKVKQELSRQQEALNQAEKKMTDLATENATLRQRIEEVPEEAPFNEAEELDQIKRVYEENPNEAFRKLNDLTNKKMMYQTRMIEKRTQQANEVRSYVGEIYSKRPELKKHDDTLGVMAQKYIVKGIPIMQAIDKAITEFDEIRGSQPAPAPKEEPKTETPKAEIPKGARGEGGATQPPVSTPEEKDETVLDVIKKRQQSRYGKAFGSAK